MSPVKKYEICSDPISADPICPFPNLDHVGLQDVRHERDLGVAGLGDSNHTVRGYCLDIPRFEESPDI